MSTVYSWLLIASSHLRARVGSGSLLLISPPVCPSGPMIPRGQRPRDSLIPNHLFHFEPISFILSQMAYSDSEPDQPPPPDDGGVQQVTLQHRVMLRQHRHHNCGKLAPLARCTVIAKEGCSSSSSVKSYSKPVSSNVTITRPAVWSTPVTQHRSPLNTSLS